MWCCVDVGCTGFCTAFAKCPSVTCK
jgi:hypothetical protein